MADVEVVLCGENAHKCNYCKSQSENSFVSFGFTSTTLTPQLYETLMLRGWRRSGNYFYKPMMHKTCCPAYTIRLETQKFQINKDQRKVLRKAPPSIDLDSLTDPSGDEVITILTERACFSDEKFDLYKRYQVTVHKDDPNEVTPEGFTRFLVESPLNHSTTPTDRYGTFHQLYRLRGKLVAVGVVDVLPTGLSAVYCFYAPEHRALALGKYTALKEIEYCQRHGHAFYYMGFYIHGCEKMRYKAEYAPSELQCPSTFSWQPLEACVPILDHFAFSPLAPEAAGRRAAMGTTASVAQLAPFVARPPPTGDEAKLRLRAEGLGDFTLLDLAQQSRRYLSVILIEWIVWAGMDVASDVTIVFA